VFSERSLYAVSLSFLVYTIHHYFKKDLASKMQIPAQVAYNKFRLCIKTYRIKVTKILFTIARIAEDVSMDSFALISLV
jgi:hypothetical protein